MKSFFLAECKNATAKENLEVMAHFLTAHREHTSMQKSLIRGHWVVTAAFSVQGTR